MPQQRSRRKEAAHPGTGKVATTAYRERDKRMCRISSRRKDLALLGIESLENTVSNDSSDKFKKLLLSAAASLGVLCAWAYTYQYTSFALVAPTFIAVVIARCSYEAIRHRREYRVAYYFKDTSPIYARLTGKVFAVFWALTLGIVYSISITSFFALEGASGYIISLLIFTAVVASHPRTETFVNLHAATGIAPFAAKKLMSLSGIVVGMIAYILFTLYSPTPEFLVHADELGQAVSWASQDVSSSSQVTNFILKGVQELSAVQWFYLRSASDSVGSLWMRLIGWSLFLVFSSLVVFGISRFFTDIVYYFFRKTKI
jgi:hypothetical protein